MTPVLIGLAVAVVTFLFAKAVGFDRDGAFYPVVLIVIAFYYILFAVMGGSRPALLAEAAGVAVFTMMAVVGFRSMPWIIPVGLAAHGVFDFFHPSLITDPGVPLWWPAFCMSADVGLGALVGFQLYNKKPRQPVRG